MRPKEMLHALAKACTVDSPLSRRRTPSERKKATITTITVIAVLLASVTVAKAATSNIAEPTEQPEQTTTKEEVKEPQTEKVYVIKRQPVTTTAVTAKMIVTIEEIESIAELENTEELVAVIPIEETVFHGVITYTYADLIYLAKIIEHEIGHTEDMWIGLSAEEFDEMQRIFAAMVLNRCLSTHFMFPDTTISATIDAVTYGFPQFARLTELDNFELKDAERTIANCRMVLDGIVSYPDNIFWGGSLEGCGASGVYQDHWYETVWGSLYAFGYFNEE